MFVRTASFRAHGHRWALLAVIALLTALLPVMAAPAAHAGTSGIARVVDSGRCAPFPDVSAANEHCENIAWLKGKRITAPLDGLYHPAESVTRGQMAAFLFRVVHPGTPSPTCTSRPFTDVPVDGLFCGYITWAATHGVAFGYADGTFGPGKAVTRGAMAAFLFRIATVGSGGPSCVVSPYRDVPVGSLFCGVIAWAKSHGITFGVGSGTSYGVTGPVTRQAMASFLHRIFDFRAAHPGRPAVPSVASVFDAMTPAQRIGQLFMVGTAADHASTTVLQQISDYHVGNVILTGRSHAGVSATAAVTESLQSRADHDGTANVGLIIAADQEGGLVQVLQGPGFPRMPTALAQGGDPAASLHDDATIWGRQLRRAGVTLNLAPVAGVVPSADFAPQNAPIGAFDREFGYDVSTVGSHVAAFVGGMHAAGVATSIKHFPGLGRVTENTDTTAGVTDSVTVRHDPDLGGFARGVDAGAAFLMMSTAAYARIDPGVPAAFSRTITHDMVRDDLGFTGVVISDDLGAAQQVSAFGPAERAVRFLAAGGDMVLTVTPRVLPAMVQAVTAKVAADPGFRATVDAAVRRVLTAKQDLGLLADGI